MKEKYFCLVCLLTVFLIFTWTNLSLGQTPSVDPNWQFKWGDEFNGNSVNTMNWKVADNMGTSNLVFIDDEVTVSGGNLVLGVHKQNYSCPPFYVNANPWNCSNQFYTGQPYTYTAGGVDSKEIRNQRFGYIEAKIKIPYVPGIFPAFWTFKGYGVVGTNVAEEIDIFEMVAETRFPDPSKPNEVFLATPAIIQTNIHDFYYVGLNEQDASIGLTIVPSNGFTYADWHTYGIEWDPLKIIWYLDNKIIRTQFNHNVLDSSRIILNHGLAPVPPVGNNYPAPMLVDYVRVYELKKDCSTVLDVCNYNFSTHDNRLKANIKIGNGTCVNALSVGDNIHLRSVEGVLINGDFTVPIGAQLYLSANPCN